MFGVLMIKASLVYGSMVGEGTTGHLMGLEALLLGLSRPLTFAVVAQRTYHEDNNMTLLKHTQHVPNCGSTRWTGVQCLRSKDFMPWGPSVVIVQIEVSAACKTIVLRMLCQILLLRSVRIK